MSQIESAAIVAAQKMRLNRKNLHLATHNMANLSTPGYQADKLVVSTQDTDFKKMESLGFAVESMQMRDTKPGDFKHTGNTLDVALVTADAYMAVQNDEGEVLYTRNGHLTLDQDGQLVQVASGFPLLDQNQAAITIPSGAKNINITSDGTLSVDGNIIAKLGATEFLPKIFMEKVGDTLLRPSEEGTNLQNASFVHQGIEASNVNPILTIAQLMEIQSQDKRDSFVIQTYGEQSRQIVDDILKPLNA